jgi:hypothetical protein
MSRPGTASLFDTRPAARKRRHYTRQAQDTLDRFADRLAEHGDPVKAAAQIGKSASYGRALLQRLRDRLGWQAA